MSGDFSRRMTYVSGHGDSDHKPEFICTKIKIENRSQAQAPGKYILPYHYTTHIPPLTDKVEVRIDDSSARKRFWGDLYHEENLKDGIIKSSDGVSFPINQLVLASISPYFRALYENLLETEASPTLEIESDVLGPFLEFAFTGDCFVDSKSIQSLLPIADKYQFQELMDHCCQYLKRQLDPSNCISIYNFTEQCFFCSQFTKEVREYILKNFDEVIRGSKEFLGMEVKDLIDFLQDELLNVDEEETIYQAICAWVESNLEERFPSFIQLLQCVRFGLMKYE